MGMEMGMGMETEEGDRICNTSSMQLDKSCFLPLRCWKTITFRHRVYQLVQLRLSWIWIYLVLHNNNRHHLHRHHRLRSMPSISSITITPTPTMEWMFTFLTATSPSTITDTAIDSPPHNPPVPFEADILLEWLHTQSRRVTQRDREERLLVG